MSEISNELLPCPFCGDERTRDVLHTLATTKECTQCGARGPVISDLATWNCRADYFVSLLRRLLATRQGRTVGYEPPEVQALWRKVEKALEGKEGVK